MLLCVYVEVFKLKVVKKELVFMFCVNLDLGIGLYAQNLSKVQSFSLVSDLVLLDVLVRLFGGVT